MKKVLSKITLVLVLVKFNVSAQIIGSIFNKIEQNKEMKKNQKEVDELKDESITGINHEKYLAKIVFDTTEISRERMNSAATLFLDQIELGSPIFARFFLPKALAKYLQKDGTKNLYSSQRSYFSIAISIDGGEKSWLSSSSVSCNPSNVYYTTFDFNLFNLDGVPNEKLIKKCNALSSGNHKLSIEVFGGDFLGDKCVANAIATSDFNLIVKKKKLKLGVDFNKIKSSSIDQQDLRELILRKALEYAEKYNFDVKYSEIKVISDWNIRRNEFGVKMDRKCICALYGVLPDGSCQIGYVNYFQAWLDGDKYQEYSDMNHFSEKACDCKE